MEYVLGMESRRFFALLGSARKILARERLDAVDIAAIPMMKVEYSNALRESFSKRLMTPEEVDQPQNQLEGEDARQALSSFFGG